MPAFSKTLWPRYLLLLFTLGLRPPIGHAAKPHIDTPPARAHDTRAGRFEALPYQRPTLASELAPAQQAPNQAWFLLARHGEPCSLGPATDLSSRFGVVTAVRWGFRPARRVGSRSLALALSRGRAP